MRPSMGFDSLARSSVEVASCLLLSACIYKCAAAAAAAAAPCVTDQHEINKRPARDHHPDQLRAHACISMSLRGDGCMRSGVGSETRHADFR
ncbi:hypothetical protein E4U55_001773 [Claviceps digitariae]|nr:hypothetical protein E4U55_001773 [Claviceps digitariae]